VISSRNRLHPLCLDFPHKCQIEILHLKPLQHACPILNLLHLLVKPPWAYFKQVVWSQLLSEFIHDQATKDVRSVLNQSLSGFDLRETRLDCHHRVVGALQQKVYFRLFATLNLAGSFKPHFLSYLFYLIYRSDSFGFKLCPLAFIQMIQPHIVQQFSMRINSPCHMNPAGLWTHCVLASTSNYCVSYVFPYRLMGDPRV